MTKKKNMFMLPYRKKKKEKKKIIPIEKCSNVLHTRRVCVLVATLQKKKNLPLQLPNEIKRTKPSHE